MKLFKQAIVAATLAACTMAGAFTSANAQAIGGRRLPYTKPLSISFYKIKPGHQDEWVDLYMKWHKPLTDYDKQASGREGEEKLYVRGAHMLAPEWDFAIVHYGPAPNQKAKGKPLELIRGEVIKKLFPDVEAYLAGEKRRWEITEGHWDDDFVEVDLTLDHPGVFYPITPKK